MSRFIAPDCVRLTSKLALGLALSAPLGCASNPSAQEDARESSARSSSIVGGYLDEATTGAVALVTVHRGQAAVFCSGSLLAPNLVLTARHCTAQIGDGSSELVDCSSSQFGAEFDATQMFVSVDAQPQISSGKLYPVERIVEAPGSHTVCGYDVSLLVLRGTGVPSAAATPLVPALAEKTAAMSVFSAIGYGLQDPNDEQGKTVGSRMRFDGAQVDCVGTACPASTQNAGDEWLANSPVCSGDSGGPALDSLGRVFGVTSRGPSECSYALYSNVADWTDFIQSTARSAAAEGDYAAPDWATIETIHSFANTGVNAIGTANNGAGAPATSNTDAASSSTSGATVPPPSEATTPIVSPLGQMCSSSCPGSYQCYSSTGQPPGSCVPPCRGSSAACPAGYSCSSALDVCIPQQDSAAHASASCALAQPGAREQPGLAAFGVLATCAWLARRRRQP